MNFRRARQAEVIAENVRDRGDLSHSVRGCRLALSATWRHDLYAGCRSRSRAETRLTSVIYCGSTLGPMSPDGFAGGTMQAASIHVCSKRYAAPIQVACTTAKGTPRDRTASGSENADFRRLQPSIQIPRSDGWVTRPSAVRFWRNSLHTSQISRPKFSSLLLCTDAPPPSSLGEPARRSAPSGRCRFVQPPGLRHLDERDGGVHVDRC